MNIEFNADKFSKELNDAALDTAREFYKNETYSIECTECGKEFDAVSGLNKCPHCGNEIKLKLNINF